MSERERHVTLVREQGYRFRVRFNKHGIPDLITDEPPPIGQDAGPSPAQLLAAAVGNCMAASLVFCLEKSRLSLERLQVDVRVGFDRGEAGQLRISGVQVGLQPSWTAETAEKAKRCLEIFEEYCLVTQAVKHGVPVDVQVSGTVVPGGAP
ncbi:MAG TPA: OsmC family protein [Candidatus Sulfotelmatobacter sp.]|nr:OsmC family protein [Candidatus Sulfotelmatobacter sp.]